MWIETDEKYEREQQEVFPILYARAMRLLERVGIEDGVADGDFWIVDSNYGPKQHKIYFNKLRMLSPSIVRGLQKLLDPYPDWAWVIAVYLKGHEDWPDMGLIIRKHEIIDGLQRQYFPPEYRNFRYEGSRVGTDRD